MISTRSKFYYGHIVDETNYAIDFDEGAAELQASLDYKSYSLEEFATEIARAMTAVGGQTYTCTVNRATRVLTVSAAGNFQLLASTGSRVGVGAFSLMGFAATDTGSSTSHAGGSGSGSEYVPQFWLQSYIGPDDWQEYIDSTVNESASGELEVVSFGLRKKIQCNIMWITNTNLNNGYVESDASAVANVRAFLQNITKKSRIEFIPDRDTTATYHTVILESTEKESKGTAYVLKEEYAKGLPGFYQTGKLIFRKVD